MKKLILLALICFCLVPALAGAEETTLTLGDGAPIPYFDGFQSELVKDIEALRGVTGAVDVAWSDTRRSEEPCTFHIHNITVTDDVIAFFYTLNQGMPIAPDNDDLAGYTREMRTIFAYADGSGIDVVSSFCEAHPVDANTLYCLSVWSLAKPLEEGQKLFVGYWDEKAGGMTDRHDIVIDTSRANDPTVAYAPMTEYHKKRTPWKGEKAVEYQFVVERVAFTPFGNRCLINYRSTSENNAFMEYRLRDAQGNLLMQADASTTSSGLASKRHPVQMYNESWFIGGEGSDTLTLVPTGGDWLNLNEIGRAVSAPLSALPAEFSLEDGSVLRIESAERSTGGVTVWYTLKGYTSYLWVYLADENGAPLDIPAENSSIFSNARGMLGQNVRWSGNYEGKIVSKASEEELTKLRRVMVKYTTSADHWLTEEDAVEIPLK